MVGQAVIFLFIEKKFLPCITFLDTLNVFRGIVISDIKSVDDKKIIPMTDILCINRIKITFTKREVMDGIKQVGLACPVISDKSVDLFREGVIRSRVIFKTGK